MNLQPNPTVVKEEKSSLLKRCFCKYDKEQNKMEIIVELTTSRFTEENSAENHFALVVDVSDSMGSKRENDPLTLLDHLKIFCEVFIDQLPENSSLSVVAFSHFAEVKLQMTQMTQEGKIKAKEKVGTLHCCGGSNISEGLYAALNTIKRSSKARGSIILFTDGEATAGDKHAKKIIRRYRQKVKEDERFSSVPVSTITVGNYRPELLIQLSKQLGSDAFYWINMKGEFEAEMLIPMWLRQSSSVTDVYLSLTALENAKIIDYSDHYVVEKETCKNGNSIKFFVHSMPKSISRNLKVVLQLAHSENFENGAKLLRLETQFLDHAAQMQKDPEELVCLQLETIKEVALKEGKKCPNNEFLSKTSCYINNPDEAKRGTKWKQSRQVLAKFCEQDFRFLTVKCLKEASGIETLKEASEENSNDLSDKLTDISTSYKKQMAKIKEDAQVNEKDEYNKKIEKSFKYHIELIDFGLQGLKNNEWTRTQALISSLSAEMPNAKGVFPNKLTFLPSHTGSKIKGAIKEVKEIRNQESPRPPSSSFSLRSFGRRTPSRLKTSFDYPIGRQKTPKKEKSKSPQLTTGSNVTPIEIPENFSNKTRNNKILVKPIVRSNNQNSSATTTGRKPEQIKKEPFKLGMFPMGNFDTPKPTASSRAPVTPRKSLTPKETVAPRKSVTPKENVTPSTSVAPKETVAPRNSITPKESVTPSTSVAPKEIVAPKKSVTAKEAVKPTTSVTPKETVGPRKSVTPSTSVTLKESVTPQPSITPEKAVTPRSSITPNHVSTPRPAVPAPKTSVTPNKTSTPRPVASQKPTVQTPRSSIQKKATKAAAPPKKILKTKNVVLSEGLMTKNFQGKSISETIIQLGATPVPHVSTFTQNTFLICTMKDFKRDSGKIRDAKNKKIPIVSEKFLYDCIEQKKLMPLTDYTLYAPGGGS